MNLSTDSKIKEKQKHKKGKGNKKSAAGGGEGTPEVSKAASLDALRQKLTQMQKLGSKYIHVYMYIRLHHHADLHYCFCTKCIYSRSIPLKKIAVFYTIFCCLNGKKKYQDTSCTLTYAYNVLHILLLLLSGALGMGKKRN